MKTEKSSGSESIATLRALADEHGLPTNGTKAQLALRVYKYVKLGLDINHHEDSKCDFNQISERLGKRAILRVDDEDGEYKAIVHLGVKLDEVKVKRGSLFDFEGVTRIYKVLLRDFKPDKDAYIWAIVAEPDNWYISYPGNNYILRIK